MTSKLTVDEIIRLIRQEVPFEAETADGSCYLKIQDYVPFACFAIHDGHRLRSDLENNCLLDDYERWYEEDPVTYDFISSLPLSIRAIDSRYEYDLNRPPEEAVYDTAWGREVWKTPLSVEQKELSLNKHQAFYQIVKALINQLEKKFGGVLVFDVHSYNYKRIDRECPVFNLGTERITNHTFRPIIDFWLKQLSHIILNNLTIQARENDVFKGFGYLLKFIQENFNQTLVLATEIKKVYCDEESGELYPMIIDSLSDQFKKAISLTSEYFARHHTRLKQVKTNAFLSFETDKDLLKIDRQLFSLVKDLEILSYVNPVNAEQSKKEFIKSRYRKEPVFRYKQLSIDPFAFKRQLYALPVEKIHDVSLRLLYQKVIDSYSDKVEIISSIGTEKFRYNSLRYFGEPGYVDIKNAEYILHAADRKSDLNKQELGASEVRSIFRDTVRMYGFDCKIDLSRQITSKVLISNSRKTVRIRQDAKFSERDVRALSEHEIGVHMLSTVNAREQKLKVFRIGFPNNTETQEGLAILSEYLSGNLHIGRLKILALRVIVANLLQKNFTFSQAFQYIMDHFHPEPEQAYYLVARIYRGGGFTKDYVYLSGFRDIYQMYKRKVNLNNLLVGKTSKEYLGLVNEMVERGYASPPHYLTQSFQDPVYSDPTLDYILEGLK